MRPAILLFLLSAPVLAQSPVSSHRIAPVPAASARGSSALIVQGGISPVAPCGPASRPAPGAGAAAIGPKQDDPAPPPKDIASTTARVAGRGAMAIGPKQDDPAPPTPAATVACAPASH